MDQHITAMFPDHPLGRLVLGTHRALNSLDAADLRRYLQCHYSAGRTLIAAAGNIEHAPLVDAIAAMRWQPDTPDATCRCAPKRRTDGVQALERDGEQAQLVISVDGVTVTSDERPQAWLANQLLGGGMSSRLFREVREMRGLAYSVGSHLSMLSDAGIWSMTCGMEPAHAADCVSVMQDVLASFADTIHDDELERAKRQLEVQFRMGLDSVEGQMLYLGGRQDEARLLSPLQWLERIRAVDADMLRAWTRARLAAPGLWSIAAPADTLDAVRNRIN